MKRRGSSPRLVGLPDQRDGIAALREMPVEAVGRDVEPAVGEPLDMEILFAERPVAGDFGALDPVESLRLFQPEAARIGLGAAVKLLISRRIDARALRPFGWDGVEILIDHVALLKGHLPGRG